MGGLKGPRAAASAACAERAAMGQKSDTAASSCVACRAAAHLAAQEPRQHTSGGGTAGQRDGKMAGARPRDGTRARVPHAA